MKQYSRLIILVGGVIALSSFALPWGDDDSGVVLANDSLHSNAYVFSVRVMFLAALLIIFTSLFLYRESIVRISKLFVYLSSIVGLICFFVLFFADSWDLDINETNYGVFLCAVGFIVAVVGVWDISEKNKIIITNE